MKTKYTMFRRGGVFYAQDSATGKQTSLRTKDETEAKSLLNARNEAQRQPVLNLHLARAYLTASDPAFVERTWQTVMEQLQSRGKDSSRERYATVFKSSSFDALRHKKLLETTTDDFFAIFKDGKVSIVYFLKRLHNFALSLGWIAIPIVAPYLWPKYEAKSRRGITHDEQECVLAIEKKAEWKLSLELLWETGAAQGDAAAMTAEDVDWQTHTITYFRMKTGSRAQFTISKALEKVLQQLPTTGVLFPKLSTFSANDRARPCASWLIAFTHFVNVLARPKMPAPITNSSPVAVALNLPSPRHPNPPPRIIRFREIRKHDMSLKPWREVVVPHADVLEGTFQQSEFAADITAVHTGKATREYQDAAAFFQRTFITEGMRLLLIRSPRG